MSWNLLRFTRLLYLGTSHHSRQTSKCVRGRRCFLPPKSGFSFCGWSLCQLNIIELEIEDRLTHEMQAFDGDCRSSAKPPSWYLSNCSVASSYGHIEPLAAHFYEPLHGSKIEADTPLLIAAGTQRYLQDTANNAAAYWLNFVTISLFTLESKD